MIKTVYFDLGNVLFFFSHLKMFEQIAECAGISEPLVRSLLLEDKIQHNYEAGLIDSTEIFHIFKRHSTRPFTIHELFNAASNIFTPNHEVWEIVKALKENGIRLIILSNTNECHFNRLYSLYPILHLFDDKILSFEVGAMKPSPQIYQKALSISECGDKECFFTDDLEKNIIGARKLGIDSEQFIDAETLKKHLLDRGLNISYGMEI